MVVLRTVNRKLMPAIDRRFFRETCNARRLLLDLGDQLAKLHDRDRILQRTAATVMKALHPARVMVLLREGQSAELQCALSLQNGHSRVSSLEQLEAATEHDSSIVLDVQDGVVRQLADDKPWASVTPETLDSGRGDEARLLRVNCELLLALEGSSGLLGIMGLGGKLSEEPYSREDRELLLSVARQMGMTLENTQLLEVAKREAQMSRDVEIARTVQQNLFPQKLPVSAGWEFAGFCRPARAVGGDYYDIFEPIPGKVLIALGDVSGKGVGASLLMASVHAAIRSRAGNLADRPAMLIAEVNRHLTETCPPGTFVTLFFGTLDLDSGILHYVNCGHPPAILWHSDGRGPEQLTEGGPVLGIIDADVFAAGECKLVSGDNVIVYSDGVTEATNASEEMFEDARLIAAVTDAADCSAPDLLKSIVKAVDDFAEQQEQADDISVLVVRRSV
jgi:sigma-B regulation protein RsbU (phosphoserine phosphatase)